MKTSRIILIVIVVILIVLIFRGCKGYNNLVTLREEVNREWANVENVYQRRADLIPNLVNTVRGYAEHEQETFTRVTEARSRATSMSIDASDMTSADLQQFQEAQGEVSSALSRLLAIVENYPELKANQNFLELQAQLEGTENRIAVERRNFNETATLYNSEIKKIPTVFFAGLLGFKERPYFEAEPAASEAPEVEF
ncbi:MAG: LemA family protein [Bacteroidales bacterium]|nr:LemA family protein [Bacteroidales bacterium]